MKFAILLYSYDDEGNEQSEIVDKKVYYNIKECLEDFRELAERYSGYATDERIDELVQSGDFHRFYESYSEVYQIITF